MSVARVFGISSIASILLVAMLQSCGGGDSTTIDSTNAEAVIGNDGPEGDSGITLRDVRYPLNAAIGDVLGVSGDHFQTNFTFTDGNFRIETITVERAQNQILVPALASAVFYTRIFSPGDSFAYATYAHVPSAQNRASLAGVAYFSDAYVGVDTNGDGTVSQSEQLDVIDGTIEFSGVAPDIELHFELTLADGQSVSGDYTGLFDFTVR